jgi:elongation factor Ts
MSTTITAQMVNELRGATGAGLLDCKKALTEANGNVADATTILRKKLGSKLDKLSSRTTKEGLIESYIHLGGKVGVLIEINCETDFVARNDDFKSFVRDLCLQIAAANPLYVSRDQVPEADLAKERDIVGASLAGKPPAVVQKIVEGKLENFYSTICLLDQPFVKQNDKSIKELLAAQIAKTGEKALVFLESLDLQAVGQLPTLLQRRYGLTRLPMVINGEVSTDKRQDRVSLFQRTSGFDVMLLSPKAGGVGLTLTAANHVIHLSRWWNPAVEDQCSDRAYRIGQTKDVHVYYPMAINPSDPESSFDLKLDQLMTRKRILSQKLLAPPTLTKEDYESLLSDVRG